MMDPFTAVGRALLHSVNFPGRATRSEFWWFQFTYFCVLGYAVYFDTTRLQNAPVPDILNLADVFDFLFESFWFTTSLIIVMFLPSLSVIIRRLHDSGHSGWWYLITIVPLGQLVLLAFMFFPSNPWPNKWGPVPGQKSYDGPDMFSDQLVSGDDPFAPGTFFGPDKNAPVISRQEAQAQRKSEIQDYYRSRVVHS